MAVLAAGCATDPYSQLEKATPMLSPGQVAELQKNDKTPEELGIRMQLTGETAGFRDVNVIEAHEDVTVPMVEIPTDQPRQAGGLYRAPVVLASVNGKPDVPVTLDSGSNLNLFGYTLARSLGIPLIAGLKPITSHGIGGSVDNYAAILPEMQIGSIQFRRMMTLVGPDEQVLGMTHSFWGDKQVMLLGVNALRGLSYLTIDNLRGNVIFGAREGYLPDDTLKFMTAVPLHWVGRLPAVDIAVDAHEAITCVLDTGGDYGMLLPRVRANEWGYWMPGKGPLTIPGGVGGASLATSYQVKVVKLGEATLTRIPARTGLIGPEVGGGNVFLGDVVLRRYRVTFDFKRDTLWLER
jgi:aspartyl protease